MDYLSSILWLLSWPLLIYIGYRLSVLMIRILERNLTERDTGRIGEE